MASSDHLTTTTTTSSLLHPCFSDVLSRFSLSTDSNSHSNTINASCSDASLPTPSLSTGSFRFHLMGLDPVICAEAPLPNHKRQRNGGVAKKRKSRPAKRSHTTFITAEPASFGQIVQQVTGSSIIGEILLPEPHGPCNRLPAIARSDISSGSSSSCTQGETARVPEWLPTLDTSAILLDRHSAQERHRVAESGGQDSADAVAMLRTVTLTEEDFELFWSFPTLDFLDPM